MHTDMLYLDVYRRYLNPHCIGKEVSTHALSKTDQCLSLSGRGLLIHYYHSLGREDVLIRITQRPVGSNNPDHAQSLEPRSLPLPLTDPPGHYRLVSNEVYLRVRKAGSRVDVRAPSLHVIS